MNKDIIISSRIRLARNVVNYSFPPFLDLNTAQNLYDKIVDVFINSNSSFKDNFKIVKIQELSEADKQALAEKRLISSDFAQSGRPGILIFSKDEHMVLMLGEEDHIRIQVMNNDYILLQAYEEAEKIALIFEQGLDIAFDRNLGFLTACTSNTGTGLRASVMLHLPMLEEQDSFQVLVKELQNIGFAIRGDHGEGSKALGSLYQISNQYTLGIDCGESLKNLQKVVESLVNEEIRLRKQYWNGNRERNILEDRILRSTAILKQAKLLSYEESCRHLSNLRLAIYYKMLSGIDRSDVDRILRHIGPASLQKIYDMKMRPEVRDLKRAKYIQMELENIKE